MNRNEAQSLMNPGLCPRCESKLKIISEGFLQGHSVKCQSCNQKYTSISQYQEEVERVGIEDLRKEGLALWPWDVPLLKQRGEKVYLVRENVHLYEGRRNQYRGNSMGMSIRVAPRLSIRSSDYSGSRSEEVMTLLDSGDLIISNQRVLFRGLKKTIDVKLTDLIAVDVEDDGLLYIARKNKQRVEAYQLPLPTLTRELIVMAYEGGHPVRVVDMSEPQKSPDKPIEEPKPHQASQSKPKLIANTPPINYSKIIKKYIGFIVVVILTIKYFTLTPFVLTLLYGLGVFWYYTNRLSE